MDCQITLDSLIDFHWGNTEGDKRSELETHLLSCSSCLKEWLTLKRDIEVGQRAQLLPSPHVRQRVLNESATLIKDKHAPRVRRMVIGIAAAAAVLILAILQRNWALKPHTKPEPVATLIPKATEDGEPAQMIDSGSDSPYNLNIL